MSLLIADAGILNTILIRLNLINEPLRLMYTETGVIIGLVHGHFLFVLLPLWAAISAVDKNLLWAAGNLGASPAVVFARIVVPLTLPALVAGAVINFTMNLAAFATPMLLGGARTQLVSYLAYQVNLTELNWPFGGAIAVSLLVLTLVPLALIRLWIGVRSQRRLSQASAVIA
jgi:spermidine/putrescine transport system permease protein